MLPPLFSICRKTFTRNIHFITLNGSLIKFLIFCLYLLQYELRKVCLPHFHKGVRLPAPSKARNNGNNTVTYMFFVLFQSVVISPQGLELIYYFTYFSTVVCFFPVGLSSLIRHFQQVLFVSGAFILLIN